MSTWPSAVKKNKNKETKGQIIGFLKRNKNGHCNIHVQLYDIIFVLAWRPVLMFLYVGFVGL